MALRIEYTAVATAELETLTYHGAMAFGRQAARDYARSIQAVVTLLADFPEIGRPFGGEGARAYPHRSHRIVYAFDAERLTVLRILHARRLPPEQT